MACRCAVCTGTSTQSFFLIVQYYPDPSPTPPPPPLCAALRCFCVSIPLAVRPTPLQQMCMGSLTCAHIWMCGVDAEGGQAQSSLLTRVDSEGRKHYCSPCPARGSNPGSLNFNSDSLTTELCPRCLLLVMYGSPNFTILGTQVCQSGCCQTQQDCDLMYNMYN